jgi:hypothetical protein
MLRAGRQDGPALSLARWNQEANKKAPAAGAGARLSVTGVTVTDRMLMDAGLSRQHRDSRNSIPCDISAKTKSRTSFSTPALSERGHSGLARRLVAMCRRAILVMPKGQCPHPRRPYRCSFDFEDAADNRTFREHVEIIFVPLAGLLICVRLWRVRPRASSECFREG